MFCRHNNISNNNDARFATLPPPGTRQYIMMMMLKYVSLALVVQPVLLSLFCRGEILTTTAIIMLEERRVSLGHAELSIVGF